MKKCLVVLIFLAVSLNAQATISGKVTDSKTGEALIGANIQVRGTVTGAATNSNGEFSIQTSAGVYTLVVSYVGYKTKTMDGTVSGSVDLTIQLDEDIFGSEVIITANRAVERETPIAFTNVSGEELQKNYVSQDVPDLLEGTPGVFVNSAGNGESEIYIRGFDAEHIQIMINGIPVNDPESQKTYWSNWSGLASAASDVQIQRGAGSSLYGSGSFGGSVNIQHGDFNPIQQIVIYSSGVNYDAQTDRTARNGVFGFKYTSGLIDGGKWNFLLAYERKTGDSYVNGTYYDGHSFSAGIQYLEGAHKITANFVGAPQDHGQSWGNQDLALISTLGREYNRNDHPYWLNHFYKPQYELHHEWEIDKTTSLSTNAFYTTGTGGGQYLRNDVFDVNTGKVGFKKVTIAEDDKRFGRHARYVYEKSGYQFASYNPTDSTYKGSYVSSSTNLIAGSFNHSWRNDSHSEHDQIGFNTSFQKRLGERVHMVLGGEMRHWNGQHFAESWDFRKSDGGIGVRTLDQVQYRYNYDGIVDNASVFARFQIKPDDKLTFMLDGQYAFYSQRIEEIPVEVFDFEAERFTGVFYRETQDSGQFAESDYERNYNFFTPKFGLNYNVDEHLNFLMNYSTAKKEPKVEDWYNRASGPQDNGVLEETINTLEMGIGYRSETFSLNMNYYYSDFQDKIESTRDQGGNSQTINAGNADHTGLEIAAAYLHKIDAESSIKLKMSETHTSHRWSQMNVSQIFGTAVEDVIGKYVPFSPRTMKNYSIEFSRDAFTVSIGTVQWSDYFANYDNTVKLPDFNSTNAKISYQFDFNGTLLDVGIHANNILNHDNYSKAAWTRDFGRNDAQNSVFQMYVQQAPLRNVGLILRLTL